MYIIFFSLKELLKKSDVISLNSLLNEKTNKIISYAELKLMKKTAFLIISGRGDLINEHAVAKALNNNLIAGAGLDVLSLEPPNKKILF